MKIGICPKGPKISPNYFVRDNETNFAKRAEMLKGAKFLLEDSVFMQVKTTKMNSNFCKDLLMKKTKIHEVYKIQGTKTLTIVNIIYEKRRNTSIYELP